MISRFILWAFLSAAALALGLAAILMALYYGADALDALGTERRAETQLGLVVYYRVILLKALWPQLGIAILGWPLLRRGALQKWAALSLGATLGYALAAPLLLTQDVGSLPALRMHSPVQHGLTYLLTTSAVVAAAGTCASWVGVTPRRSSSPDAGAITAQGSA